MEFWILNLEFWIKRFSFIVYIEVLVAKYEFLFKIRSLKIYSKFEIRNYLFKKRGVYNNETAVFTADNNKSKVSFGLTFGCLYYSINPTKVEAPSHNKGELKKLEP